MLRYRKFTCTCVLGIVVATCSYAQEKPANSLSNDEAAESNTAKKFVPAADGGLGSTMTIEQLSGAGHTASSAAKPAEKEEGPLIVRPASEPSPALKYRLWPRERELKAGSAQLFYLRALVIYRSLPDDFKLKTDEDWFMDNPRPDLEAMHQVVESMGNIYDELHAMAMCEDFDFDHHWRNIKGPEAYAFLLPEVQDARALARLLALKIDDHLARREFAEAIEVASDGYRLAYLMGKGETLVQQLVGIAIAGLMREKLEAAIQTPGCPNLYWAIASLPKPLSDMRRSLDIEMSSLPSMFPALLEAEKDGHTEEYWAEQWKSIVESMKVLGDADPDVGLAMAVAPVTFAPSARKRLETFGYDRETLAKMPNVRVILLDAQLELRRIQDEYEKTSLLPYAVARKLISRENRELDEWLRENKSTSAAAALASVAFPFARVAREAEARSIYSHQRLMTIEAVRMHAVKNGLPASLDQIEVVPAMLDPFSGKTFKYERQGEDTFVLRGDVPKRFKRFAEVTVRVVE